MAQRIYQAIAEAWTGYLGEEVAHERARNAAMALLGHDDLNPDRTITTLTRCFEAARLPCYGSREVSEDQVSEAVARAIVALSHAPEAA
jgi:hypothetical protein